jgi:hypothetical protein
MVRPVLASKLSDAVIAPIVADVMAERFSPVNTKLAPGRIGLGVMVTKICGPE